MRHRHRNSTSFSPIITLRMMVAISDSIIVWISSSGRSTLQVTSWTGLLAWEAARKTIFSGSFRASPWQWPRMANKFKWLRSISSVYTRSFANIASHPCWLKKSHVGLTFKTFGRPFTRPELLYPLPSALLHTTIAIWIPKRQLMLALLTVLLAKLRPSSTNCTGCPRKPNLKACARWHLKTCLQFQCCSTNICSRTIKFTSISQMTK